MLLVICKLFLLQNIMTIVYSLKHKSFAAMFVEIYLVLEAAFKVQRVVLEIINVFSAVVCILKSIQQCTCITN